jgi:hypothetical protein
LTDSNSFFSAVTQYNALREKRLSIEVAVVREAYEKFELANLRFVRTAYNLADPMTKHVKNTHLDKLLDTGVVDHPVEEYITRAPMTHDASFNEADMCYALLRMRPLLNSWAECSVVISCGKVDYDKSG